MKSYITSLRGDIFSGLSGKILEKGETVEAFTKTKRTFFVPIMIGGIISFAYFSFIGVIPIKANKLLREKNQGLMIPVLYLRDIINK